MGFEIYWTISKLVFELNNEEVQHKKYEIALKTSYILALPKRKTYPCKETHVLLTFKAKHFFPIFFKNKAIHKLA